jgi:hypothetical protein
VVFTSIKYIISETLIFLKGSKWNPVTELFTLICVSWLSLSFMSRVIKRIYVKIGIRGRRRLCIGCFDLLPSTAAIPYEPRIEILSGLHNEGDCKTNGHVAQNRFIYVRAY